MKDRFLLAQVTDMLLRTGGNLPQAPDAVICTGDLTAAGRPEENDSLARVLSGLRMPCFLLPGSHDDPAALRKKFPSHAYLAQRTGKLDYVIDDYPVRIVALDSNVPLKAHGMLSDEQLDWLEATLAAAPSKPTIVAVHHPPFWTGIGNAQPLKNPVPLETVVSRHPQVERVVCGQVQRGIVRRFGGTIACTCPRPPGFLLHLWQAGKGLVTHLGDGSAEPLE